MAVTGLIAFSDLAHVAAENGDVKIGPNDKSVGKTGLSPYVTFSLPKPAIAESAADAANPTVVSAAAGDFDSDGVPDLVSIDSTGQMRLMKGDARSVFPGPTRGEQMVDSTFAPFSNMKTDGSLDFAPDEIATGDFNADGHLDILAAKFSTDALILLAGDGQGNFPQPLNQYVPGAITSISTGEIGRADGQTDVAVGFVADGKSYVAVFEHPEGAFSHKPEIFAIPQPASAISIGQLDRDPYADVAVGGGEMLTVIHGRGQAYPLDMLPEANIQRPAAAVRTMKLDFTLRSLVAAEMDGKRGDGIAMLAVDGSVHYFKADRDSRKPKTRPQANTKLKSPKFVPAGVDAIKFVVSEQKIPQTEAEADAAGQLMANMDDVRSEGLQKVIEKKMEAKAAERAKIPTDKRAADDAARAARQREMKAERKRLFEAGLAAKPIEFTSWKMTTLAADARLAAAAVSGSARLIKARVSTSGVDDLLISDTTSNSVMVVGRWQEKDAKVTGQAHIAQLETNAKPTAVIPMRLNVDGISDLVTFTEGSAEPTVLLSRPAAVLTVNTADDAGAGGNCQGDGLPCDIRRAVFWANFIPNSTIAFNIPGNGVHTIHLNSALADLAAPVTIDGTTQPGYIDKPLIELKGDLLAGGAVEGFRVTRSNTVIRGMAINQMPGILDDSIVGGSGIVLLTYIGDPIVSNVTIESNFLGTDAFGTTAFGNDGNGVQIYDADNNLVGGTIPQARNILSGNGNYAEGMNGVGFAITGGNYNRIFNNYVGPDVSGNLKLSNTYGSFITGTGNQIGGDQAGTGNVISGNGTPPNELGRCSGVGLLINQLYSLDTGAPLTNNTNVKGNLVGTNASGIAALSNCTTGISSTGNINTSIGSITPNGRNTVSGNKYDGIWCGFNDSADVPTSGSCSISGNEIGTNRTGNAAIPNSGENACSGFCTQTDTVWLPTDGIDFAIVGSPGGTTPGGACTGFCNLISGNYGPYLNGGGVLKGGAGFGLIVNNYIGTNRSGDAALPNFAAAQTYFGSALFGATFTDGQGNLIPGGNLVAGNHGGGVGMTSIDVGGIFGIKGNTFGLSSDGLSAIPNGIGGSESVAIGVVAGGGTSLQVGGISPNDRNYVTNETTDGTGPRGHGISSFAPIGSIVAIQGNYIGLDPQGNAAPNTGDGVVARGEGTTYIGGGGLGSDNIIANNGRSGVFIYNHTGPFTNLRTSHVTVRGNVIKNNGGLGIDLTNVVNSGGSADPDGLTPNDCFDQDDGANGLQNFPELYPPVINGNGTVSIPTTFRSIPARDFTIDYYQSPVADPTNYGEGANYLGSVNVRTDGNGFAGFTFTSPNPINQTQLTFTATATDEYGNTSEFSCAAGVCTTVSFQQALANPEVTCAVPIVVNVETDDPDPNTVDGSCDVDTNTPGPQCSLRAAIQEANARNGFDIINFDIPGGGVRTIMPMTALPTITERVIVNGTSQPGHTDSPLIELKDGSNTATGLTIQTNNVTITGLAIHRFIDANIHIQGSENVVESCFIGISPDGMTADNTRRALAAIDVQGTSSQRNRIGGTVPANSNVIGNSNTGIFLRGGEQNTVINNKIGTNKIGTAALPNNIGVAVVANGNTIGGILDEDTNLISGNTDAGVFILALSNTNRVEGNLIGTDATGSRALRNGLGGLILGNGAVNNTIGGANERRNIISGNAPYNGIIIQNGAGQNPISGNYIGLNKAGTAALPNKWGVAFLGGGHGIGSASAPPNIISGNEVGVVIGGSQGVPASGVHVVNNRIGTDPTGQTAIRNTNGIALLDVSNSSIFDNLISGNTTGAGVVLAGGENVGISTISISNNKIGTELDGTNALPNKIGILLAFGVNHCTVSNNTISGNTDFGVQLGDGGFGSLTARDVLQLLGKPEATTTLPVEDNTISNNRIGTTAGGIFGLGNGQAGVFLGVNARNNTIGGQRSFSEGNVISGNNQNAGIGIAIGTLDSSFDVTQHPSGNRIQGNRIGIKSSTYTPLANNIGIKIKFGNNNLVGGDPTNCTPGNGCDIDDYANIIGGNAQQGIWLEGASATGNRIISNYIGVAPDGTPIGNGGDGVHLTGGAQNNDIGAENSGNTISGNGGNGIFVEDGEPAPRTQGTQSTQNNRFVGNQIFGNVGLAIDIFPTGSNPNDVGDGDGGPNRGQNYPQINQWNIVKGDLLMNYRVDSLAANSNYGANGIYVEFFEADMSGEGERFIGSNNWTLTDLANGGKVINLGNAAALGISQGDLITASATDADGNTSEFFPPFSPTAAGVSVSGRILEPNGNPIRNSMLTLTDTSGHVMQARSNPFGLYRFDDVEAGRTYVLAVSHKHHTFTNPTRVISVVDELTDVDFTSDP